MNLPHLSENEEKAILFLSGQRDQGVRNVQHEKLASEIEVPLDQYNLLKENLIGMDLIAANEPTVRITDKTIQAGREIHKRREAAAAQNVDYVAKIKDWGKGKKTIAAIIVVFGVLMFFAAVTNTTISFLKNVGWIK